MIFEEDTGICYLGTPPGNSIFNDSSLTNGPVQKTAWMKTGEISINAFIMRPILHVKSNQDQLLRGNNEFSISLILLIFLGPIHSKNTHKNSVSHIACSPLLTLM